MKQGLKMFETFTVRSKKLLLIQKYLLFLYKIWNTDSEHDTLNSSFTIFNPFGRKI
jgi:hypothetical protein